MIKKEGYASWLFVVFPALTMLLGWGLRGHIGGGPFGAMIPGALVALTISMLLELPAGMASVFVVFGAVGIGLGGEMTYGQTLGFLKNPDTIWWGTLGTTVKGSIWGLLGGGLGFGLGGFWMVLGFHLPGDVIFQSWWKAMEFTFGLLLGGALGYSAWLSRKEILRDKEKLADEPVTTSKTILKEFAVTLIVGLLIYFGLIMIIAVIRFPTAAWQIAITLTFCHAAINLMGDFYPDTTANSPFTVRFALILLMTTIVALLTAIFQRRKNILHTLFLLLVWSTVTISFLRLFINPESLNISGLSFCKIVCGKFIVDIIFLVSALIVSWISIRKIKKTELLISN